MSPPSGSSTAKGKAQLEFLLMICNPRLSLTVNELSRNFCCSENKEAIAVTKGEADQK